jgi:uncharacterized phage protein (TIGR01671 family)
MKEIKFRAWDIENNKMIKSYAHVSKAGQFYTAWTSNDSDREYIPMQSTGLKDKNGVEIYEGDILQDDERPVECGVVEWDYDSLIVNNAQITPEWRKTTVESGLKYRHWIIIGNIYENPELLEKGLEY